jgi:phospholipase C
MLRQTTIPRRDDDGRRKPRIVRIIAHSGEKKMQSKRHPLKSLLYVSASVLATAPVLFGAASAQTLAAAPSSVHATPAGLNDNNTATPIKHVIIIVGENRSFDHMFATYKSPSGDKVLNILSEGIINAKGKPGPKFANAVQNQALDNTTYMINPLITGPYTTLPAVNLNGTPSKQSYTAPPFISTSVAANFDYGLLPKDLVTLTTGASGLPKKTIDTRITNVTKLKSGPYTLDPGVNSDQYANSPVHRYYQMFQQMDCAVGYATPTNPSGCRNDLFPWVEVSVGAGSNGGPQPPNFTDQSTHEGAVAMGFYNVQEGDIPYLKQLADEYTILDNYHQPAKGGTFLDSMYLGYADDIWYSDGAGNPVTPPSNLIENPDPQPGTNNWYTQDGYSGGSYSNCSDSTQKGVASVNAYLSALGVKPNCAAGHYYLLNNIDPGYLGDGTVATYASVGGYYVIPPSSTPSIADVLIANNISWAYFGENWNAFVNAPALYQPGAEYCNICNPFLYETSIMTGADPITGAPYRITNLKDTTDLYDDLRTGELPAVSYVKPSGLNDGHPESSKMSIFEGFVKKVVTEVQKNGKLAKNTAIMITVDEGGGYWDSGYIQQLDFFGDGTRIPMIIVSPYTKGGHVSHVYSDHASVVKFIEANWGLGTISKRSRDNMPNPITAAGNDYVPINGPAISDLMAAFQF